AGLSGLDDTIRKLHRSLFRDFPSPLLLSHMSSQIVSASEIARQWSGFSDLPRSLPQGLCAPPQFSPDVSSLGHGGEELTKSLHAVLGQSSSAWLADVQRTAGQLADFRLAIGDSLNRF